MAGIIVNLSDEQIRIIELHVTDVEGWIYDAVNGLMNKCLKQTIQAETRLNKDKLSHAEMYEELAKEEYKDLKSRKEKEKDFPNG
jgi:hypothetical protein